VLEIETSEGNVQAYHPELNEPQRYLWEVFMWGKTETEKLASGNDVVIIHVGDLTQGNFFPREQISTQMSDQLEIAAWNMKPLMKIKNLKAVCLTKGTGSHEFGEGSSTVLLRNLLRAEYPKIRTKAIYHAKDTIAGATIDYAHHGTSAGIRSWLRGNQVRYYLQSIMDTEIKMGNAPADLYLRGHYHSYVKELVTMATRDKEYESTMITLPGFCMLGDYGTQATKSTLLLSTGMVAIEIINGKIYQTHKFIRTLDLRSQEVIL
jgi:hypothetical protein